MVAISMRKLKERLAQLEAESLRISSLVEHYRLVISDLEAIGDDDTVYSASTNMRDAMEQILKGEGTPLHYRDIYNRLVVLGVRVNGDDPVRNTGAHLSSDDRFESIGSGKWGLAEWKYRAISPDCDVSDKNTHATDTAKPRGKPVRERESTTRSEGEFLLDDYVSTITTSDLPQYDETDDLPF